MGKKGKIRLALIGTDSLQGKEIKSVLERKSFPMDGIEFFDTDVESEYSKLTQFQNEPKVITAASEKALSGIDLLFLASDKKVNQNYARIAAQKKIVMIDLRESLTDNRGVPVVAAGINSAAVLRLKPWLIANPNPTAFILSHLFHAIREKAAISRAVANVLLPVSIYGEAGIQELASQSVDMLSSAPLIKKVFKAQIAFNLLSQVGTVDKQGFSPQERQILRETREILDEPDFPMFVSLVQAPVFHTHSVMLYVELEQALTMAELEAGLSESSYVKFAAPSRSCPVSAASVAGHEKIHVGQMKQDVSRPHIFWIWAAADNLVLGSALNAYEIARAVVEDYFT